MFQKINTHTNTHTHTLMLLMRLEWRKTLRFELYSVCRLSYDTWIEQLHAFIHPSIHANPHPPCFFLGKTICNTYTCTAWVSHTNTKKVCFECCVPHNEWHSCAHVHANTHPSQVPQTADPGLCILKRNNSSHSFITFCKNISPPTAIIRWTFSFHSGHILF